MGTNIVVKVKVKKNVTRNNCKKLSNSFESHTQTVVNTL